MIDIKHLSLPCALFLLLSASMAVLSNDIEPRLLTNIPVGTNFVGFSYTRSEGNVAVDPSLALDVEAELNTYVASYTHAFGLFGKSATITGAIPYADLTLSGKVGGQAESLSKDALADPALRFAINFAGAPAMTPQAFVSYRQRTIIGLNIEVTAPLGDYDPDKAVNFGANRWSISPEIGVSHRAGRFTIEGAASLIWFSENTEYRGNSTLQQDVVYVGRVNLLFHFKRPGTWIGIGSMYLSGGSTSVDGEERNDLQIKSRTGIGLSLPIVRRHSVKLKYSTGVTTRVGADFDNYSLGYVFVF